MSPEIALYAAAIAAALVGIGSLLKALRASQSQGYELFSDSEEGTGDSGGIGDSEEGTGDSGGTGTEDEPPAQQTFVIPLAFSVMLVLYFLLLAHGKPTWHMIIKAGVGIGYILCQIMMAVWRKGRTGSDSEVPFARVHRDSEGGTEAGRTVASSILAMWMLGMPFLQCQWWLFGVSTATCIVSSVVLHYADLGQDNHYYGLAASLMAAWLAALTVVSTWSWVSLLLMAPGMYGFYGVPLTIKELEAKYRTRDARDRRHVAELSLYLIWSLPLPLLTNASWQLLAPVLFAGFGMAALSFIVPVVDYWSQVNLWAIGTGFVIRTLLPLAVVWWSGEVPQLFETVPPWMLRLAPVTFGAMYIWMEVCVDLYDLYNPGDTVYLFSKPYINAFGQAEIMSRVLVLLILLATPWALALDTAQLQQWGQIPDFYLPDYLTLQFGENSTWQNVGTWHLPNATWHSPKEYFLHMTWPRWPDLANATNSMARAKFWVPLMAIKLVGATVFAMLVLGIPCLKVQMQQDERVGDDRPHNQLKDVQRTSITICLVVANLALCTKLTLTASMAGQLTSGGMVWEGFDEILTWGLLWLLAQAMALRLLNGGAVYAPFDVALSTLFVFPYLGDGFDSLKDAMLASVAIESDVLLLRYLGIAGLTYLWVLHLCVLLPVKSSRLELESAYLPMLLLKPTRTGSKFVHSRWVKFCTVMYKQTTPTRRKAMLAEDLPQALLACLVSMSSKGSMFTVVTNIAIPVARLIFAVLFHASLAETVKDWLLEQAVEAFCYDRVEASNEFTVAMSRVAQVPGKDDIWESHLLREAKDRVDQKLEQVESLGPKPPSSFEGAIFPTYLRLQLALQGWEEPTEESQKRALVKVLKMTLRDPSLRDICSQLSIGFGPKLTAIDTLDLSSEKIGDEGAQPLADVISNLTATTKLHLGMRNSNMSSTGCKAIATALCKLTNIQELELNFGWNNVGDEGAEALADAISHLTAITKLNLALYGSKITSEGCEAVAANFSKLIQIHELFLELGGNTIGDAGAETLTDSMSQLAAITKLNLDLSSCNITSGGCKAVATLAKLTKIQELTLNLRGNAIGDAGAKALAERLPELQELVMLVLHFDGDGITSAAAAAVKEAAAKLPRLTESKTFIHFYFF